jgi:hypothetical protein
MANCTASQVMLNGVIHFLGVKSDKALNIYHRMKVIYSDICLSKITLQMGGEIYSRYTPVGQHFMARPRT